MADVIDATWRPWGDAESTVEGVAAIGAAARELEAGWIVVHPTSTVYGLGGRPRSELDGEIARLKRREHRDLIVLAASVERLRAALPNSVWTAEHERLADAFWPGPLTLVLSSPDGSSRAVRVDEHPVVRAVLERAGGLMTSTSLNVTGEEPARTRDEVESALEALEIGEARVGWLDAGDLPVAPASTIVAVEEGGLQVLREGEIDRDALAAALATGAERI